MGLYTYLFAKTKCKSFANTMNDNGVQVPITTTDGSKIEIGCWRKAYSVTEEIFNRVYGEYLYGDDGGVFIEVANFECEKMLESAENHIRNEDYEDEYEKNNWIKTAEIFKKALAIYRLDEEAEIYYYQWY